MESGNTSKSGTKRGTRNKRWPVAYTNYLIPLLVEQANLGLKCDKTFKKAAFVNAAAAVNDTFKTDYSPENVENHYRTLKTRYAVIKKAKELSGAGWDDNLKMITLDPMVCKTYTDAHPAAKPFINKPIDNYEGLRIICGEDQATGSYATSIYSDFARMGDTNDVDDDNMEDSPNENSDEDVNPNTTPPVVNTPNMSSTSRPQRSNKRSVGQNEASMDDLVRVVGDMAHAIKNPTQWYDILYQKVMEVDGIEKRLKAKVFDWLFINENEGKMFMVKDTDLRQAWMEEFITRIG